MKIKKLLRKLSPAVFSVLLVSGGMNAAESPNELTVFVDQEKSEISRMIYGHFSEHLGRCIYEGIYVGEDSDIPNVRGIRKDVVRLLKDIDIPVLRWPGGCFADEYHWKDGIGPKEERPSMINTHWGKVVENNHFGTHEFLDLCEQLGTEPAICGNVGSGTPQEMMEWVEYMTSDAQSPMADLRRKNGRDKPWKVTYFGVGNESWGCGGNMRPEYYADLYRRFQTFCKDYPGNKLYKIAGGANSFDYEWTDVLMKNAARHMDGLSLHYYTLPSGKWGEKGKSTGFGEDEWFSTLKNTLKMEELVVKHGTIMDYYDPDKRVGLIVDEWGTWYDPEPGRNPGFLYQQNTLRDALVAGINLNIFNNHSDRVKMANIAQTVNVLQAVILTDKSKLVKTPTYHVFDLYKVHHDATLLGHRLESESYELDGDELPSLNVSVSTKEEGVINATVCNLDPNEAKTILVKLPGYSAKAATGTVITATEMDVHNRFDEEEAVSINELKTINLKEDGTLQVILPSKSVSLIQVEFL